MISMHVNDHIISKDHNFTWLKFTPFGYTKSYNYFDILVNYVLSETNGKFLLFRKLERLPNIEDIPETFSL